MRTATQYRTHSSARHTATVVQSTVPCRGYPQGQGMSPLSSTLVSLRLLSPPSVLDHEQGCVMGHETYIRYSAPFYEHSVHVFRLKCLSCVVTTGTCGSAGCTVTCETLYSRVRNVCTRDPTGQPHITYKHVSKANRGDENHDENPCNSQKKKAYLRPPRESSPGSGTVRYCTAWVPTMVPTQYCTTYQY